MRQLVGRQTARPPRFSTGRLAAMSVAVLVGPAALAIEAAIGHHIDVWPIVIGSVTTFVLVIARMWLGIVQVAAAYRERQSLQDELAHTATHDGLTGLPNRAEAVRAIESAISRAARAQYVVAALFVDLDGFKAVNDSYGHAAGDRILTTVAERLGDAIRAGDVAARLGGDEFVVVLENCAEEKDAVLIAQRIVESLCRPVDIGDGMTTQVGASVGVAFSRHGEADAHRLLREADTAVYRVKDLGGNRVEVFDDRMREDIAHRLELEAAIARAVRQDELVLHYQPVIGLGDGAVTGFEALVRWQRPDHGLVMPADFLPVVEESPVMSELDAWVLRTATRQAQQWLAAGGPPLTMAVNISARHLRTPNVVDTVRAALEESGLDPALLVLEITETAFVDHQTAAQQVTRLHELGVAISIDDFGTGYNWITRLRLPYADVIKTDRSFLGPQQGGRALLEYTVQVAHAFGIPIVVEGVERAEQLEWVRSLGCESAQGYLLGTPLPPDDAEPIALGRAGTGDLEQTA
jgi:diguanylate cyclase (GGDEF)-like protein